MQTPMFRLWNRVAFILPVLLAFAVGSTGPGVCWAEEDGHKVEEQNETAPDAPLLGQEKEAIAQQIFNELVSPCCWTTTVAQHGSGKAPVIQAEVRQMLASGTSKAAIMDHFVQEYGERILAKPKRSGFNLAAYWVPYLAMLVGAGVIFVLVRRGIGQRRGPTLAQVPSNKTAAAPPAAAPLSGTDAAYRQQIDEELRRIR